MTWVVVCFGLLVLGVGLWGFVLPARLIGFIESAWKSPGTFAFAIGVRVVLGIALLLAAPECRHPDVARALGVIALVAAVAGLALGRVRIDAFIAWWVDRPADFVRGWSLFAVAFGAYLVFAAA